MGAPQQQQQPYGYQPPPALNHGGYSQMPQGQPMYGQPVVGQPVYGAPMYGNGAATIMTIQDQIGEDVDCKKAFWLSCLCGCIGVLASSFLFRNLQGRYGTCGGCAANSGFYFVVTLTIFILAVTLTLDCGNEYSTATYGMRDCLEMDGRYVQNAVTQKFSCVSADCYRGYDSVWTGSTRICKPTEATCPWWARGRQWSAMIYALCCVIALMGMRRAKQTLEMAKGGTGPTAVSMM